MEEPALPSRPTRVLRRLLLFALGAMALIVVLLVVALPWVARPYVERTLTSALEQRVRIGTLSWDPFRGAVSAGHIAIGSGDDEITAEQISVDLELLRLLRDGQVVAERIDVEKPVAILPLDAEFRPVVGRARGSEGTGGAAPPAVTIREVAVNGGQLTVRYPVHDKTRNATLQITRFRASDVDFDAATASLKMSGQLKGTLDGAPVDGDVQLRVAGEDTQMTANFAISGVTVSRDIVPLPETFDTFSAKIDARGTVEVSNQPPRRELQLDLRLADAHARRDDGTELSAKAAALPKIRVDLSQKMVDLGAVTVDAPMLALSLGSEAVVPAKPPEGETGESAWAVRSAEVEIRGGTVRVQRGEIATSLALESVRWDGLRPDRASKFALKAKADSGGSVAAEGTVAAEPLAVELEVRIAELAVTPALQLIGQLPLQLSKGTASGNIRVGYRGGLRRLEGDLAATDVHTAPPDPARQAEVMAFSSGEVKFSMVNAPSPTIDVSSLKLSYPYMMVHRDDHGTFPFAAFGGNGAGTSAAPPATGEQQAGIQVRVERIEVENGKLEFLDATLDPPFWTSLTDVTAEAEQISRSEGTIKSFKITAKQDELSPVEISGALSERGLDARADVQDVLLGSLNGYVSPVLGYRITSGRLSSSIVAAPAPPLLDSTVDIVLRGIDLLQTGRDTIQEQSGVPLPIALGLIANAAGEIRLTLPFMVDTRSRSVSFGSIVWQAIRSAIIGALTSPIRLLGSLFGTGGAPHAFAIDPIPFQPGSGSLDQTGRARAAQIARILEAHQGLLLVLMPQVTPDDIRKVGADGASTLANERNAAARDAFVGADADPRLPPDRLLLVPWEPSAGADATRKPGVYVELQEAG